MPGGYMPLSTAWICMWVCKEVCAKADIFYIYKMYSKTDKWFMILFNVKLNRSVSAVTVAETLQSTDLWGLIKLVLMRRVVQRIVIQIQQIRNRKVKTNIINIMVFYFWLTIKKLSFLSLPIYHIPPNHHILRPKLQYSVSRTASK